MFFSNDSSTIKIAVLFVLISLSSSCQTNEFEIDSDCLIPLTPLKDLLINPIPFGLNSYQLKSSTNNTNHRLLLIISPDRCSFADANRCRSYESKSSQTLYLEPYLYNDVYYFDFYLTISFVYYTLVQLAPDSVHI